MALFMIERQFAERLQLNAATVKQIESVNDEIGVHWLFSFLAMAKVRSSPAITP